MSKYIEASNSEEQSSKVAHSDSVVDSDADSSLLLSSCPKTWVMMRLMERHLDLS